MAKYICPTPGFEKLLIATDGSEFSKAAINEAIDIAKACSSKLFVLSVVEINPEYESIAPEIVERAEKEIRKIVKEIISATSAASQADMGKVMGVAMGKVSGRADGGRVSELVKSKLS